MAAHTCVVVADAARARFLQSDAKLGDLTEVEDLVHPASRERTHEIVTDRKGSTRGGPGSPKSGTEGPDAQEQAHRQFARVVARRIGEVRGDHVRVILASPPRFLGMVRKALDSESARVVDTVNHDFTRLPIHRLADALRRHLD